MFRKSKTEKQLSLQSSVSQYIEKVAYKQFADKNAWHNQFYTQITSKIDENIFSCLYADKIGAPNASISQLIAMMLLKEGHGWSDKELYENCRFNMLVRKALGIINLDETIPSESTYYLLRKNIVEYNKTTDNDLFALVFKSITKSQVVEFKVSGKSTRMDSKLIGSNIASFSRYEIIHKALCLYHKNCKSLFFKLLTKEEQHQIKEIIKEDSTKTVYRSTKEEINAGLTQLGLLIYKLLNISKDCTHETYQTLKRIFEQQYKVKKEEQIELRAKEENVVSSKNEPFKEEPTELLTKQEPEIKRILTEAKETQNEDILNKQHIENQVENTVKIDTKESEPELRSNKEISAQSIQSPYDTDCHYRKKNDIQIKGYSHNITETCNDEGLNLITDVQIEPASAADNNFVIPAIKNTNELLTDKIENLHTDGAYQSPENNEYTKENGIQFYPTGMQGAESRYDLTVEGTDLKVTDRQTGEVKEVTKTNNNKYRINTEKGYRYFGQTEIEKSQIRKQIEQIPTEIKNKRNNVEATIYQVAFHLRKDKTKYRGLIKNTIWSISRCLWINFARIVKYVTNLSQKPNSLVNYIILNNYLTLSVFLILNLTRLEFNRNYKKSENRNGIFYPILKRIQKK